jgi:hypothetical protein
METCPKHALTFTEQEPDESKYIFELNDKVLVKEYAWKKLK